MHEMSLACELCRIAEAHLPPEPVSVRSIGVEVGRGMGIEVSNFQFCLEALLQEPPFSGAALNLVIRPGSDLRLSYLEVDDGRSTH